MESPSSHKRNPSYSDGGYSSDTIAAGGQDEKTIPFLRRLRDMLVENEEVISFISGNVNNGKKTLGRLIVHDRLAVEATVLPKYFNHSSFASLRRQLNYFSFVRVGKGRQRESTYINEAVVELTDILHLKRRPASAGPAANGALVQEHLQADGNSTRDRTYVDSVVPVVHLGHQNPKSRHKRRRLSKGPPPESSSKSILSSPVKNLISEDEVSEGAHKKYIALDLTRDESSSRNSSQDNDDDILAGCSALLGLSKTNGWA